MSEESKISLTATPESIEPPPTSETPLISPEINDEQTSPIVGIGASAGGLEALESFFANMPPDSGIAFIIIQHLAPNHKSFMGDLLQKQTKMPVVQIEDGILVQPDRVYLNPPGKQVAMIKRTLQLLDFPETPGIVLPIDAFFRTLAEDQGERAICIILSGTGSDGTLGVKAVKSAGGLTMAQDEQQAKHSGMPHSAIESGMVDFTLPVEKMADELLKYVRQPYIKGQTRVFIPDDQFQNDVQKIFALIRTSSGHDFSNYKQTTIRRRIERRMALHQIYQFADYVRYLQTAPNEVETLFKEMLIGVTNFFRDTEAFDLLAMQIFPEMLLKKPSNSPLRIWTPGCATGEEAYSLAILLTESMERLHLHQTVQIFASDIDVNAINMGRLGVYPENIAADVSPERLQRFFMKEEVGYKVKKQIRDMVIFAVQNLIKDPPFSRVDMICCRNLLIYMATALQKRVLPLFHYALLPGGVLFLGSSESIGEFSDLFAPLNSKWKLFLRKDVNLLKPREYHEFSFFGQGITKDQLDPHASSAELDVRHLAERVVLDYYAPPCVLLNERGDILYMIGAVDRYLQFLPGAPNFNLLQSAREGLRYKLSAAVQTALKEKTMVNLENVNVKQNGGTRTVNVLIRPLHDFAPSVNLLMAAFVEVSPLESEKKKRVRQSRTAIDPRIAALEQELQSTKEYLQTTIEELETSNEELKSTNEELQSVNEELQSTNEELETSKEELQSTNEELMTVNSELQDKVEELSRVNNDINNLLASTEIGVIFMDQNLRIKRFTPAISKVFNLIKSDLGRPISDITTNIEGYPQLHEDARAVLETLDRKALELRTKDGLWFIMRIAPYRTVENIIDGVVVTFVDISRIKEIEALQREIVERKRIETMLQENDASLRAFIENAEGSCWSIDANYCVIICNEDFKQILGQPVTKGDSVFCERIPPEIREEWRGYYDRALCGESFTAETATCFSGVPANMAYRFTPIRNSANKIIGATIAGRVRA